MREYIEAAQPQHPSLIDTEHVLERAFGVVNIPNVIWIDEAGMIVRPAEPGWAGPAEYPEWLANLMAERERKAAEKGEEALAALRSGQDRTLYADAIRDWAAHGSDSRFAMTRDEVVAASRPRDLARSEAAARFELGADAWRRGDRASAFNHWRETHRLDQDRRRRRDCAFLYGWRRPGSGAAVTGQHRLLLRYGASAKTSISGDLHGLGGLGHAGADGACHSHWGHVHG